MDCKCWQLWLPLPLPKRQSLLNQDSDRLGDGPALGLGDPCHLLIGMSIKARASHRTPLSLPLLPTHAYGMPCLINLDNKDKRVNKVNHENKVNAFRHGVPVPYHTGARIRLRNQGMEPLGQMGQGVIHDRLCRPRARYVEHAQVFAAPG